MVQVRAIDDGPAATLRADQFSPRQNREMRRHGVGGHRQLTGDIASRHPGRLSADKQAEHVEAGRLGQGGKSLDGCL